MIWTELNKIINDNNNFLISSHLSLDGDCIGSQLAFLWYLQSIGKKASVYCVDPLPQKFEFLKDSELISQVKPQDSFDILMVLDCSNVSRLGWDVANSGAKAIINIDHHRDNTKFGAVNYIDSSAAAAGEIIFSFFKDCNIDFPSHVAETLYTAIMTDTGGFRFSNTSSKVLRICAELIDKGADCAGIYDKVYSSHTPQTLLLQSRIWSTLTFHLHGQVCSMDMPLSILNETGAKYSDSEGMADFTVSGIGTEVGIMTKHTPDETHFSLRSRGKIDVGQVAQMIPGGGGHSCAAGCTIKLPYKEAMEQMLAILAKELE
ncbi:MAG: bifunctional oligoribonuclease/PAP phosphatase NrnA [Chitinispirillales bacterium]|jgi:phosphoesterase RecJ-like protein|nr:bifunctional oligoribonuclease/PAP phosphatase NrnA [Chitinispirillales bacterium]